MEYSNVTYTDAFRASPPEHQARVFGLTRELPGLLGKDFPVTHVVWDFAPAATREPAQYLFTLARPDWEVTATQPLTLDRLQNASDAETVMRRVLRDVMREYSHLLLDRLAEYRVAQ